MTWEEYCKKKKIDSDRFRTAEPERWKEWKNLFEQIHPNSFTEQKKFLINDIRRKYHLKMEEVKEPLKQETKTENSAIEPAKPAAKPIVAKKPGGIKIPPRKSETNE